MTQKIKEKAREVFAQLENYPNLKLKQLLQYDAEDILRYKRPKNQLAE